MKTIYDQVEEELKAIEQPEAVEEVVEEPVTEEEPVEEKTEEVEEPKVEEKVEEKPDHAETARLQWENRELKRQQREAAEAAQRAIEVANAEKQKTEDPEPNKAEDREEWLEWKVRQADKVIASTQEFIQKEQKQREQQALINGAIQEFQSYEQRFALKAPDYDDAAKFFQDKVKESISTLNPHLNANQIAQMAANQLLTMGSQFVNQGLDPAEAIYNIAKRQGFTKEVKQDNKPQKASLETIEKNKAKSPNGLGSAGGKSKVTIATLEKASIQDMYDFSDEEIYNAQYKS